MTGRDLLDLVRIPNVFTAMSDIVAAAALSYALRPNDLDWGALGLTMAASAAFYTGGMALNDVADADTDLAERPTRPIPSGRVSRGSATGIAAGLLVLGLALAWLAGGSVLLVAALLVACIVAYDLALAGRAFVGPLGMASCRALNLVLGLTAAGGLAWPGFAAAALHALYVFGLTHLSLGEVEGSRRAAIGFSATTTIVAAAGVLVLGGSIAAGIGPAGWVAVALALAVFLGRGLLALARAWVEPIPSRVGPAVGALVTNILWWGAALATSTAGAWWLAPFLVLAACQESFRRTFRVT